MTQDLPWKYLDILLDVPWLGMGKAHDDFEELLTVCLGLGHSLRMKAFEIATDTILLLDSEAQGHQLLQQLDCIDARCKTFLTLFPPNTTDADAVWLTIFWRDWRKVCINGALLL